MTGLALDPILDWTIRGALAAILVLAAQHKLRDRGTFEGQLGAYELLPESLVHAGSRAAPLIELAAALFLLARSEHAAFAGTALFLLYGIAIAVNLARGRREIDCGCGGPDGVQALHWALVARNLVLALGAAAIALPVAGRATGAFDYAIAALAALTIFALYLGFNHLIAQLPASRRLKA